jgi:hypothetical protein
MASPARALILALLVVCAQARLEPVRWWWSPSDAALVGLTPQQAMAVERLYQEDLSARNRASQEVTYLEEELKYSRQWDAADDERQRLTEELAKARVVDCGLRRRMLQRMSDLLSARQREQLTGLVSQNRFMESTCLTTSGPHDRASARSDSILRE